MATETLDYQEMVQEALRGVVRRCLELAAEHGLPGEHYFYLGFRTAHPGVRVPAFLRSQFPEEVTIILQHQFWDLEVDEEGFSVTLNFNASRQRLSVPFAALTAFVDPSVEFGLRFGPPGAAGAPGTPETPEGTGAEPKPEARPELARIEPGPTRIPSSRAAGRPKSGEVVPFDPSRRK